MSTLRGGRHSGRFDALFLASPSIKPAAARLWTPSNLHRHFASVLTSLVSDVAGCLASLAEARSIASGRSTKEARIFAEHRRADDHHRGRRQRRPACRSVGLRQTLHRQVPALAVHRRHRPQPAPGSTAGIRQGRHRRRQALKSDVWLPAGGNVQAQALQSVSTTNILACWASCRSAFIGAYFSEL